MPCHFTRLALAASVALAAGCAVQAPPGALIADPHESLNRDFHEFNRGLDTVALRPLAYVYREATPTLIQVLLSNFYDHIDLPVTAANDLLQGEFEQAAASFGRFGVNTILGAGGLLDPATEFGLPYEPNDFGLTLADWGMAEGPYLVLPIFGPATGRDAFGLAGDLALDPTTYAGFVADDIPDAVLLGQTLGNPLIQRSENFELVDNLFYDSPDSYVALRSAYVQRRRSLAAGDELDPSQLPDIFAE